MYVGMIRVFVIRLEVIRKQIFDRRFLINQLIRIHILPHIQMGPSVEITPHGDPQKYQDLQAPQKNSSSPPPKKKHFSETP